MKETILAFHYADRLKAAFLLASTMLDGYERAESREGLIHALFDVIEGEINSAGVILSKTGSNTQKTVEDARHFLHKSIYYFNTGEISRGREELAKAISCVTTLADKSMRKLGL